MSSVAELRALTFRLYVDGQVAALSATNCSEAGECSGGLPRMSSGQHTLELASVLDGIESHRSGALTVLVAYALSTAGDPSLSQFAPLNTTICPPTPQTDCYRAQVLASGLGQVTALSPMPDGRVMFIEDGQRVRVIARETLSTAIALPSEGDRQLTCMAVDTRFEESRFVFVAWTEFARGVAGASITRYRELENALGEGATIATGLPASPDGLTPLAVDDAGLVYVAAPLDPNIGPRFLGNAGVVMRVDRDGRVPPTNHRGSPIVAESYPAPRGLAIELSSRRVWLTGLDHGQFGEISAFAIPGLARSASWPIRPWGIRNSHAESAQIDSIAIVSHADREDDNARLVIARGGRLQQISVTPGGTVTNASDVPLSDGYVARTVASDHDGSVYVSAATRDGSSSVLKLARLRGERR